MKLCIFTYQKHLKISKKSCDLAIKNLKGFSDIVFLYDDLSEYSSDKLLIESKKFLTSDNDFEFIKYSEFPYTSKENYGWLRQQYVKMQLHKKFKNEDLIILDGDCLILKPYRIKKNSWNATRKFYPGYFNFLNNSLGLQKNNNFSYIFQINVFNTSVLEEIEKYSIRRNNKDLIDYYMNVYSNFNAGLVSKHFSEFEIYGHFASQILGKEFKIKHRLRYESKNPMIFLRYYKHAPFAVWSGFDENLENYGFFN